MLSLFVFRFIIRANVSQNQTNSKIHGNTVAYFYILLPRKLYTFIRSDQEQLRQMQLQVPGRNRNCGPAIPVQRSNQLSYRVQLLCQSIKSAL